MKNIFQKFLCGIIALVSMLICFCSCVNNHGEEKDPVFNIESDIPVPSEIEFSTVFDLEKGIVATDMTNLSKEDAFQNIFYLSENAENFCGLYFKIKGVVQFFVDEEISDLSDTSNISKDSKIYLIPSLQCTKEEDNSLAFIFFFVAGEEDRCHILSDFRKKYEGNTVVVTGKLEVIDFNDGKYPCLRNATIEFVEE